ncbi:hypothetical protein RB623_09855 [Mesorhizobium sp. LHD-90]|uniref:hypothetical protein n=1 Tax=Mesorhizobium sp. LHD-90 TaxID=3071414 RepID=UPI0027E0B189|nr:hypothetical protein [Mesorhizobium sp. LHD-90]MDQ6434352.1 hypothetical protein [Mesorhizobium sp. LHD-90]
MDLAMEGQALRRIAVMLIALAGLAERVAGRPRPLRGLVIWLLRPAEAVAREFVIEALRGARPEPMAFRQGGDSADEAMRLASCLRALASALDGLSAHAARLAASLDADRTARRAGGFLGSPPPHPARAQASRSRRISKNNNSDGYYCPIRQAPKYIDTS